MSEDDKRTELIDQITQIEVGGDHAAIKLMATALVREVLPALDRMEKQIAALHWHDGAVEMALGQIDVIYAHLQDMSGGKQIALSQERVHWQEQLEHSLNQLREYTKRYGALEKAEKEKAK